MKDIVLPGDMKAILSQLVEAEKSAQANVIRRREETAATRSLLNTAKVMENNPVALRLKSWKRWKEWRNVSIKSRSLAVWTRCCMAGESKG